MSISNAKILAGEFRCFKDGLGIVQKLTTEKYVTDLKQINRKEINKSPT
jgi:hypothetical protein